MGSKERRNRERQDTREKILAAARLMFAQEGYEAVTMRAIAERVEYTPTAIYHHFANKQALVTELCNLDFLGLAQHFSRAAAIADPVERIRAIGEAYLQFAIDHPYHYRFMFMTALPEIVHSPEFVAERLGNPQTDGYAFFRLACEQAIQQQRLRPEFTDSHEVAQLLWAVLHGLISLRITKQPHDQFLPWRDLRVSARNAVDVMFRGILRDPATIRVSREAEPKRGDNVGQPR
jgi:AcrR family transcriptional regulator